MSLGDGTYVLLDPDGLKYFALGTTGSRIWKELEQPVSLRSLSDTLMSEFDVDHATCTAETKAFVEELVSRDFVTAVP